MSGVCSTLQQSMSRRFVRSSLTLAVREAWNEYFRTVIDSIFFHDDHRGCPGSCVVILHAWHGNLPLILQCNRMPAMPFYGHEMRELPALIILCAGEGDFAYHAEYAHTTIGIQCCRSPTTMFAMPSSVSTPC